MQSGSCESLSSKGGMLTGSDSGIVDDTGGGGDWDGVPVIIRQCLKHLEAKGLHTLGIFRVSPSQKRVKQVRSQKITNIIQSRRYSNENQKYA